MPIAEQFRQHYARAWRTITRPSVLLRCQYRCERCGAPSWRLLRARGNSLHTVLRMGGAWFDSQDDIWRGTGGAEIARPAGRVRQVRVVITIAHLNHMPGDDRPENLAALCQSCHLRHDQRQHVENAREKRITRKDAERPLLGEKGRN